MCSCCLVSTMCFFFRHLSAKVFVLSDASCTCQHRKLYGVQQNIGELLYFMWAHFIRYVMHAAHRQLSLTPTSSTRPKPPIPSVATTSRSSSVTYASSLSSSPLDDDSASLTGDRDSSRNSLLPFLLGRITMHAFGWGNPDELYTV